MAFVILEIPDASAIELAYWDWDTLIDESINGVNAFDTAEELEAAVCVKRNALGS